MDTESQHPTKEWVEMNKQDVVKENVGYDESYSEAKCPSTRPSINEKARMESQYLQTKE